VFPGSLVAVGNPTLFRRRAKKKRMSVVSFEELEGVSNQRIAMAMVVLLPEERMAHHTDAAL
jgi:hypothetical protein